MREFPCKDCEKRKPGCHSICEKYLKAKEKSDSIRETIHRKNIYNKHFYA